MSSPMAMSHQSSQGSIPDRTPSPSMSVLTSPFSATDHSPARQNGNSNNGNSSRNSFDASSILTSPYSMQSHSPTDGSGNSGEKYASFGMTPDQHPHYLRPTYAHSQAAGALNASSPPPHAASVSNASNASTVSTVPQRLPSPPSNSATIRGVPLQVQTQQHTPPATIAAHQNDVHDRRNGQNSNNHNLSSKQQVQQRESHDFSGEAGAAYYMHQMDRPPPQRQSQMPRPSSDDGDDDDGSVSSLSPVKTSGNSITHSSATAPLRPIRHGDQPMAAGVDSSSAQSHTQSTHNNRNSIYANEGGASSRASLTHKPSGARAPPATRSRLLQDRGGANGGNAPGASSNPNASFNPGPLDHAAASSSLPTHPSVPTTNIAASAATTTNSQGNQSYNTMALNTQAYASPSSGASPHSTPGGEEDVYATDAMAALNFLDRPEYSSNEPASSNSANSASRLGVSGSTQSMSTTSVSSAGTEGVHAGSSSQYPQDSEQSDGYKSSFSMSKSAAERKAKAAAQQAAQSSAALRPGRSKSKRQKAGMAKQNTASWESSEEEEEEEQDDDDDDDVDSDEERRKARQPAPLTLVRQVDEYGQLRQLPQAPSASNEYRECYVLFVTDKMLTHIGLQFKILMGNSNVLVFLPISTPR
jgi:CCR4-NOT transcriptional complex subunit CAF120